MTDSTSTRDNPISRRVALLLSSLVLTPDEGLEAFRDRRCAAHSQDREAMRRARAILDAVGYALLSESRSSWRRVEEAYEILRRITRPDAGALPAGKPGKGFETVAIDRSLIEQARHATPFIEGAPVQAPRSAVGDLPPAASIEETAVIQQGLRLDNVLPFDRNAAREELTLEQYASLRAELDACPDSNLDVARRYGIDDEQSLRSLDESWRARLEADGQLRERFDRCARQYRRWLDSRREQVR